jgi:type II secretory pathway component PulJ
MPAQRRRDDDTGSTLMELVVGMALMGIFLSIFTTAVFQMSRTINKVDAVTTSSGQANQAFLKLDKLVRYASAISTAGKATSGSWYIEMDNTANGSDVCTQLRIDAVSGQLQQRTWTVTTSGTTTASSWQMLAYGITNGAVAVGSSDQPFTVPSGAAAASSPYQQLALTLVVKSGGSTSSTTRTKVTFTAINSTASSTTNSTVCQQKGRP